MDESHEASFGYFSKWMLKSSLVTTRGLCQVSNFREGSWISHLLMEQQKGKPGKPKVAFLTGDGSTRRGRSSQQLDCERQMAQRYLTTRAYTQIPPPPPSLSTNPRLHCKNRRGARDGLQRLVTLFLRAENFQTYKWSVPSPLIRHLKTGLWFIGSWL